MTSKITINDVYNVVNRLEDKMDRKFERYEEEQDKILSRVTTIESFNNRALGVLSVVSVFVNIAASYVWNTVIGKK